MKLRPYQADACYQAWAALQRTRSCLIVAPTGAGKTIMGRSFVEQWVANDPNRSDVFFVVHRRELEAQSRKALAGIPRVKVLSVQAVCAKFKRQQHHRYPVPSLVVLDEAHHYVADQWRQPLDHWHSASVLGLTATPERSDGRPLGDLFSSLVVSTTYPDLIAGGYLVPLRVLRGRERDGKGQARDPVEAYREHAHGQKGFAFCRSKKEARTLALALTADGSVSEAICDDTPKAERDGMLARFRTGQTRMLCNVNVLTEGVDVPDACVCLLARNYGHITPFLQAAGRVMRTSPGKTHGVLIDLHGCTYRHGIPGELFEYSLGDGSKGSGIKQPAERFWLCMQCAFGNPPGTRECKQCGWTKPAPEVREITIYSDELREVYAGENTPDDAQLSELHRLCDTAKREGYAYGWVKKQFHALFKHPPNPRQVPVSVKKTEYDRLQAYAASHDYKPGFAYARYKGVFGESPQF